jgi:hypothetical protein
MTTDGTEDIKAIRLLNQQLGELQNVRGLNYKEPLFEAWRDTTKAYLERFLPPDNPHIKTFQNLNFMSHVINTVPWGSYPRPSGYISPADQQCFLGSCNTAEATIKAVLRYIEEFGVYVGPSGERGGKGKSRTVSHGGVQQNFYGSVEIKNQAIATDNAIQRIGQMGDMGASLKEIAELFQQSEDLTKREIKEGLRQIEVLASEIQKPPDRRNWESMLESGEKVLAIAGKAADLAHNLAPHIHWVAGLVEKAKRLLA